MKKVCRAGCQATGGIFEVLAPAPLPYPIGESVEARYDTLENIWYWAPTPSLLGVAGNIPGAVGDIAPDIGAVYVGTGAKPTVRITVLVNSPRGTIGIITA